MRLGNLGTRMLDLRRQRGTAARRIGVALALCLVAGVPACSSTPSPDKAFGAFLAGWAKADFTGVTLLTDDGQPLAADAAKTSLVDLEGDLAGRPPQLKLSAKPKVRKDLATATVDVAWPLAEKVAWTYQSSVQAKLIKGKWAIYFGPTTVHPDLTPVTRLALTTTKADRGPILDGTGAPIVTNRPVVIVGVEPKFVTDLNSLITQMAALFKSVGVEVDLSGLPAEVKAASPDAFVEVATLRREAYDKIRNQLRGLPGTVFDEDTRSLAPTRTFARALLGGAGEVTKELMDKNPGKYQIGDVVGLNGLQQRYDSLLQGVPGASVSIAARDKNAAKDPNAKVPFHSDPKPGAPIKTTLDVATQNAADAALTGVTLRSALVAIRISDGAVVAVANGPNGGDLNLAMTGQVPPGSTFKAVTALGVLDNGSATADTVVACPKTLTVDGRAFANAHGFELGDVPLHTDFAKSCNTAFASLAPKLGPTGLSKTAATLGIGVTWDLGADCFTGKVSSGGSAAEQAAAAFGQGTTQVSPIALASAAAAIARGQWKQPHLVLEPAPTKAAPDGPQLKPEAVTALRAMMREVVTDGTAVGVKGIAGAPIFGKTGTAEFDNNPDHTHSWFMGYRGDIAFAVFIENGGLSTDVAVPLAGKFFTLLG
jgi:cell division protein FtsI/penicillin-binding protein 2